MIKRIWNYKYSKDELHKTREIYFLGIRIVSESVTSNYPKEIADCEVNEEKEKEKGKEVGFKRNNI